MQKKTIALVALAGPVQVILPGATSEVRAQVEKAPYPAMALLNQYLMPDEDSEIAVARRAASGSISDGAEVLVRSWGAATNAPEFWNPKVMAPICVNPPAARTYLPTVLMKATLVLKEDQGRGSHRRSNRRRTERNGRRPSPARCAT